MRQYLLKPKERREIVAYVQQNKSIGGIRQLRLRTKEALRFGRLFQDLESIKQLVLKYSEDEITKYVKEGVPLSDRMFEILAVLTAAKIISQSEFDDILKRQTTYGKEREKKHQRMDEIRRQRTERLKYLEEIKYPVGQSWQIEPVTNIWQNWNDRKSKHAQPQTA